MKLIWLLIPILMLSVSCKKIKMRNNNRKYLSVSDVSLEKWDRLAQKRVFFGHQSVGNNIIDGVKDIIQKNPQIRLNIVLTRNKADFSAPVFGHSEVGQNTDPQSKLDDFAGVIDGGLGEKVNFALLKFCYIDIADNTNIVDLFAIYKNKVSYLKTKYPQVAFVHTTIPLNSIKIGLLPWIKVSIKKILGKPDRGAGANLKRNEFNMLVRQEYYGKEPVFDIAEIESTFPDSRILEYTENDKTISAMVPEYTDDGGHLNTLGRQKVAEQLLVLLANLEEK